MDIALRKRYLDVMLSKCLINLEIDFTADAALVIDIFQMAEQLKVQRAVTEGLEKNLGIG